MNMLKDRDGKPSSKRIIGLALTITGALFLLIVGVMSLFKTIIDPGTALRSGVTILTTGGSLLGVSTIEHISGGGNGK